MLKHVIALLLAIVCSIANAQSYTDFYCDSAAGSNLNGGSTSGAALFTRTNGNWNSSTRVYTATGDTLDTGWVGQFASVYIDGATEAVYIARITSVDNTAKTLTMDSAAKIGTAPASSGTGRTIKVGGAWAGPSASTEFPFALAIWTNLTNSSGHVPRVNCKGTFARGNSGALSLPANAQVEGYGATAGDGTNATFTSTTANAALLLCGSSGTYRLKNLTVTHTGATASSAVNAGVYLGGTSAVCYCERVTVTSAPASAFYAGTTAGMICVECDASGYGYGGFPSCGGFVGGSTGPAILRRCSAHGAASGAVGALLQGAADVDGCVFAGNSSHGLQHQGSSSTLLSVRNCVFYNNGGSGIRFNSAVQTTNIYRCVAVNNAGWAVSGNATVASGRMITIDGLMTYGNASGVVDTATFGMSFVEQRNMLASSFQPMVDPDNGNFTLKSSQGRGVLRGNVPYYGGSASTVRFESYGIPPMEVFESAALVIP